MIFAAGLLDDVFGLPPLAKLAAQLGASAIVLSTGLKVTIVTNHYLALALATVWLVGMTNAFNMLDNMDGLAAALAAIAALFFAIDAAILHANATVLVVALALFNACLAFLPFNLRREGGATIFMGDSGSQLLGFTLAACGIAATLKVAQTTVATLILPLLILAVPILDTTLVTIVRLFEGRPLYQGGRDHSSHRLVYHGLSDRRAVILLATIGAALGATSLTYTVIDDKAVTVIGVLLTFAFIVQFASFLADVDRNRDARAGTARGPVPERDHPPAPLRRGRRRRGGHHGRVLRRVRPATRLRRDVGAALVPDRDAAGPALRALPRLHPVGPLPRHLAVRGRARRDPGRDRRRHLGADRVRLHVGFARARRLPARDLRHRRGALLPVDRRLAVLGACRIPRGREAPDGRRQAARARRRSGTQRSQLRA